MGVSVAVGAALPGTLLVTNELQASPAGERELLCKLNHDVLRSVFGDRLTVVELKRRPLRGIASVADAIRGYIDGFDQTSREAIFRLVESKGILISPQAQIRFSAYSTGYSYLSLSIEKFLSSLSKYWFSLSR